MKKQFLPILESERVNIFNLKIDNKYTKIKFSYETLREMNKYNILNNGKSMTTQNLLNGIFTEWGILVPEKILLIITTGHSHDSWNDV